MSSMDQYHTESSESNTVPEVLDADECGTIELTFYDDRVADDPAFAVPRRENQS